MRSYAVLAVVVEDDRFVSESPSSSLTDLLVSHCIVMPGEGRTQRSSTFCVFGCEGYDIYCTVHFESLYVSVRACMVLAPAIGR